MAIVIIGAQDRLLTPPTASGHRVFRARPFDLPITRLFCPINRPPTQGKQGYLLKHSSTDNNILPRFLGPDPLM